MPTYEYECQRCGQRHEAFQSITAKPLTRCSKCAGRLKRLLGIGAGFLFKGSGFYITDYRSARYRAAQKNEQPSSGSSASTPSKPPPAPSAPSSGSGTSKT